MEQSYAVKQGTYTPNILTLSLKQFVYNFWKAGILLFLLEIFV